MAVVMYLHGFMSSERSHKAMLTKLSLTKRFPQVEFVAPRLDDEPVVAMRALYTLIESTLKNNSVGLIGSSLGGFYAHHLAERYGIPAVLINPAVAPYELLTQFLGPQTNPYTQKTITLGQQHIEDLRELECPVDHKDILQVWLQTGDELLDYQLAEHYFAGCDCRIQEGGDHSFQHFEQYCPEMMQFLLSKNESK